MSREIPPVVPYYQQGSKPDADIVTTKNNLANAETELGHKWVV